MEKPGNKIVRKSIDINEDSYKMLKLIATLENYDSFKKYIENILEEEVARKKDLLKKFLDK